MNRILLAFALLTLSSFAQSGPKDHLKPHTPATQLTSSDPVSFELWFVGDWICTGIQHDSPTAPPVRFIDRFRFRMALGDSWLMYRLNQVEGPHKGQLTLIGTITWDANAHLHVRRDMNIGGSRMDMTTPGWNGNSLVSTGYMVTGDQKLLAKHTLIRRGNDSYGATLEFTDPAGVPVGGEEADCKRTR